MSSKMLGELPRKVSMVMGEWGNNGEDHNSVFMVIKLILVREPFPKIFDLDLWTFKRLNACLGIWKILFKPPSPV